MWLYKFVGVIIKKKINKIEKKTENKTEAIFRF